MLSYYNDLQPDIWIYDTSDGYEAMEGVMDQEASDESGSKQTIGEQALDQGAIEWAMDQIEKSKEQWIR